MIAVRAPSTAAVPVPAEVPSPRSARKAHKLYLDTCSLVNAARHGDDPSGRKQSTGVELEFKYRF